MEVSPLSARHLTRRDRQRRPAWLANKEYHEIPPHRGLAIGHVQVRTFHFSFLQPANVRPGEKDFLDLIMYGLRVERPSDSDSPDVPGTIASTKRRLLGILGLFVAVSLYEGLTVCWIARSMVSLWRLGTPRPASYMKFQSA